jgi:hypothetical protein
LVEGGDIFGDTVNAASHCAQPRQPASLIAEQTFNALTGAKDARRSSSPC